MHGKPSVIVAILGFGMFAAGMFLGFVPVRSGGTSCGSAFHEANFFLAGAECDALRTAARPWAAAAIVLALTLLVIAAYLATAAGNAQIKAQQLAKAAPPAAIDPV